MLPSDVSSALQQEDIQTTLYNLIISQLKYDYHHAAATSIELSHSLSFVAPSNLLSTIISEWDNSARIFQTLELDSGPETPSLVPTQASKSDFSSGYTIIELSRNPGRCSISPNSAPVPPLSILSHIDIVRVSTPPMISSCVPELLSAKPVTLPVSKIDQDLQSMLRRQDMDSSNEVKYSEEIHEPSLYAKTLLSVDDQENALPKSNTLPPTQPPISQVTERTRRGNMIGERGPHAILEQFDRATDSEDIDEAIELCDAEMNEEKISLLVDYEEICIPEKSTRLKLTDHLRFIIIAYLSNYNSCQDTTPKGYLETHYSEQLPEIQYISSEEILRAAYGIDLNSYVHQTSKTNDDGSLIIMLNMEPQDLSSLFGNKKELILNEGDKTGIIALLKPKWNTCVNFHLNAISVVHELEIYTVNEILAAVFDGKVRENIEIQIGTANKHSIRMLESSMFNPGSENKVRSVPTGPLENRQDDKFNDYERNTVIAFLTTVNQCSTTTLKNVTDQRLRGRQTSSAEEILKATFGDLIDNHIKQDGDILSINHHEMDALFVNKDTLAWALTEVEKDLIISTLRRDGIGESINKFHRQAVSLITWLQIYTAQEILTATFFNHADQIEETVSDQGIISIKLRGYPSEEKSRENKTVELSDQTRFIILSFISNFNKFSFGSFEDFLNSLRKQGCIPSIDECSTSNILDLVYENRSTEYVERYETQKKENILQMFKVLSTDISSFSICKNKERLTLNQQEKKGIITLLNEGWKGCREVHFQSQSVAKHLEAYTVDEILSVVFDGQVKDHIKEKSSNGNRSLKLCESSVFFKSTIPNNHSDVCQTKTGNQPSITSQTTTQTPFAPATNSSLTLNDHDRNTVIALLLTTNRMKSLTSSFKRVLNQRLPDTESLSVKDVLDATFGNSVGLYIEQTETVLTNLNHDKMEKQFKNKAKLELNRLEKDQVVMVLEQHRGWMGHSGFHKKIMILIPHLQMYTVGEILLATSPNYSDHIIEERSAFGTNSIMLQLDGGLAKCVQSQTSRRSSASSSSSSKPRSQSSSSSKPPSQSSSSSKPPSQSSSSSKPPSQSSSSSKPPSKSSSSSKPPSQSSSSSKPPNQSSSSSKPPSQSSSSSKIPNQSPGSPKPPVIPFTERQKNRVFRLLSEYRVYDDLPKLIHGFNPECAANWKPKDILDSVFGVPTTKYVSFSKTDMGIVLCKAKM